MYLTQPRPNKLFGTACQLSISDDVLMCNCKALFEEPSNDVFYIFVEASKGYDGLHMARGSWTHDREGHYKPYFAYHVTSPNFNPCRFVGWLHRRYDKLQIGKTSP
jgi:hypothetical protein